jgi:serine/threonine protein kinase
MSTTTDDPRVGSLLNNRYRITERLASGGMGVVYRGERLELGRPVAIKFLHESFKENQKILSRFEREARAMSKLSHPYCVSVIDFGVERAPYIVMDYVTGKTLRSLLAKERLITARAIRITDQLLSGLAHAHGQGIIHRDIKPENIVLSEAEGLGEHVRILDFGLAKLLDRTIDENQSTTTVLMGTPSYMSPEQTQMDECDSRSDLYSTGIMLFEMLAGRKPFFDESAVNVLKMHRDAPPPKLCEADPNVRFSDEMEAVIKKALAKPLDERFQTAEDFAAALHATPEAMKGEPDKTPPTEETESLQYGELSLSEISETNSRENDDLKRRRLTLFRAGAAALLVAVVAGLLVLVSTRDQSKPDSEPGRAAKPVMAESKGVGHPDKADSSAPEADRSTPDAGPRAAPPDVLVFTLDEETANQPPPTVEAIRALINEGRLDEAIDDLKVLRHLHPSNPNYTYLLANVYFDKQWWADAMDLYKVAIRLNPNYKGNATINNNLITALSSDKTYGRARKVILKDIGKPALPFLQSAAKRHKYQIVRERAGALAKKLSRRWFW